MLQDESTAGPRLRPMRAFVVAIAAAAAAPFIAPATAEPVFDCSGTNKPMYETVCGAQELRDLGGEIDTELARLLRGADPLSAMLLKRDQIWFREILAAENTSAFHGQQDTVYARLLAVLKVRRHALARLRTGSVTTPAGSWSNAFAAATVGKAAGDALTITLQARLSYANENRGEVACAATATAALGKDGWYSATIGDKKDDKGNFDVIRFRLQGNTLRVVHETNHEVAVCTGSELSSDDSSRQAGADVLTGTFFAAGPAASANGSAGAPMIAPSFPCATAENADEQEICADPDLALADVEIARLYRQTIRRLDRKLTAQLRADQRAWASENAVDYLVNLQPGSDKAQSSVHHTSAARSQLSLRQNERILLLANLDETRKGLTGLWLGHNGSLTLVRPRATATAPCTAPERNGTSRTTRRTAISRATGESRTARSRRSTNFQRSRATAARWWSPRKTPTRNQISSTRTATSSASNPTIAGGCARPRCGCFPSSLAAGSRPSAAACADGRSHRCNFQTAKHHRPYSLRRRVHRRPFRPPQKAEGMEHRAAHPFLMCAHRCQCAAPLGAPSRRLFRPGAALSNWPKPACQRAPRTRVVMPGERGPGAARGAWVTFPHARRRRSRLHPRNVSRRRPRLSRDDVRIIVC